MKYTTRIKHNEWKDGDIICFPANQLNNKPLFDTLCEVINSKLYQFPHMAEYTPDENFEAIRIDYKFISDGTWFKKGTEAYPTQELTTENNSWGAVFVGYTNETYHGYSGTLPRWDGEICSLTEFKIEKR